ncbi:MAG: nucleotidyltransferase domain-containing protein [Ferruginibacter sp.]
MNFIDQHINEIRQLCFNYRVKQLYALGSVINKNFNEQSDIDLLVNFESLDVSEYADNYYDFKFSLEKIFNRQVDLIEDKAIKNPFFRQNINNKRKLIYGD